MVLVLYLPRTPGVPAPPGTDLLVHAGVFGLVTWTARLAGLPVRWVVAALLAHALLSEVVQETVLPARSGDPVDLVADVLGVAIGAGLPLPRRPVRSPQR
jgi:VanZ family protein